MAMDMFGAMGGAAKGMGGMGGGNGGSFAQKQMMKSNPVMQGGGAPRMGMMRGQGPQMASNYGMQGPNKMRPTAGLPFGNMMKPGMGQGIAPRYQGQMGGVAQGMGNAMPPWMQQQRQQMQPQVMPQEGGAPQMPEGPQRQTQNPNAPGYDPGFAGPQQRGGLAEMFRKMQMQQGQQQQGGGYNTGINGGMMRPRGIAPQLSMMPQFAPQQQQPNPYGAGYGEEEQY